MPVATQRRAGNLEVAVVCVASRWRILARGELDLRSGDDLVEVAGVLAASGVPVVDIDLADITFIDTAGWRAVTAARRLLAEHGASSVVSALSPAVTYFVDTVAATSR